MAVTLSYHAAFPLYLSGIMKRQNPADLVPDRRGFHI